jgi:hypothetical protein
MFDLFTQLACVLDVGLIRQNGPLPGFSQIVLGQNSLKEPCGAYPCKCPFIYSQSEWLSRDQLIRAIQVGRLLRPPEAGPVRMPAPRRGGTSGPKGASTRFRNSICISLRASPRPRRSSPQEVIFITNEVLSMLEAPSKRSTGPDMSGSLDSAQPPCHHLRKSRDLRVELFERDQ